MRRLIPFRLTGLCLAALFFVGVVEGAAGIRYCAHHDVPLAAGEVGPEAEHAGSGHAFVDAATDPDAVPPRISAADPGEEGHDGPCICLGDCQTGTIAGLPQTPSAQVGTERSTFLQVPAQDRDTVLPGPIPYALPYAQAPPLTR